MVQSNNSKVEVITQDTICYKIGELVMLMHENKENTREFKKKVKIFNSLIPKIHKKFNTNYRNLIDSILYSYEFQRGFYFLYDTRRIITTYEFLKALK